MADRSDDAWEPWGPWVLAIGTAIIGGVAVVVTGVRVIRKRLQNNSSVDDR